MQVPKVPEFSKDSYDMKTKLEKMLSNINESSFSNKTKQALFDYYNDSLKKTRPTSQHRSLYEAFRLLQELGKNIEDLTLEDITKWWKAKGNEYTDALHTEKPIKRETLRKTYHQIKKFLRIMEGLKKGRVSKLAENLDFDFEKQPSFIPFDKLPTQKQVKELIELAYSGVVENGD